MVRTIARSGFGSLLLCLALAAPAQGDTADVIAPQNNPPTAADGWQAGTCVSDVPPCSPETPALFFTQAQGHPPIGFTQFIVQHETVTPGVLETPVRTLKDIRVDLPEGLSVNPQATEQCPLATFEANASSCPPGSVVGVSEATVAAGGVVSPPVSTQVYNLVPNQGEPALFGFTAAGSNVFLKSDVEWNGDYHEGFTIAVPPAPLGSKILRNRLVFTGIAGNGTFLTNPSTCHDPAQSKFAHTYSTWLRADSTEEADPSFPNGSHRMEAALPPGVKPSGCQQVPFAPSIVVTPGTTATDSPDGATVDVRLPFEPGTPIANSDVAVGRTTLPPGAGLNPSAAAGLEFCSDEQFGKGSRSPVACPTASKIGTVAIETPPLPAGALTGNVFVGKQLSRDPTSGNEYRIFIDAESARFGVSVRLVGKVSADPRTGQLTTTIEAPQVPFSSFKLRFDGGARAVLTSPPTCGPHQFSGAFDPYTETAQARPTGAYSLSAAPGGGACPTSGAARPFSPSFSTHSKSTAAGAYSPFSVTVERPDGQQELKGVDVTLPPGLSGKLAGVAYCPEQRIAAAVNRSGALEAASPSCPTKSRIGTATIRSGTGTSPVKIQGTAYLAGPYRGAPLSMAVITPATAGPFDLGVVVVRVALFVDPDSARIRAVSDPIPHVFGGALLDIRSIDLSVDRKEFVVNPTSCGQLQSEGTLRGGGNDPNDEAGFASFAVTAPFQTTACKRLKFRPRLVTTIISGRRSARRAQNPRLRAVLRARGGDANVAKAVVTLPKAVILDQSHIGTVCTRPQQAAGECPKNSIYGHAVASSPLLAKKLHGPVYLVPSSHVLPDLLVALHGQVDVRLHATTHSTKNGRLRTVFYGVPDVPVSTFVLTMNGGKHGLLTNTQDLCARRLASRVTLRSQNGKRLRRARLPLRVRACHRKRHRRHRRAGGGNAEGHGGRSAHGHPHGPGLGRAGR